MCAPGAKARGGGDAPVTLLERGYARADGEDLETAFVAGDGGRFGCSEEGVVGWFGAVGALDGVYVCGIDGRGEGADEDGGGGE